MKRIHLNVLICVCLYKVLKKGGNAVDAAIASTLCIGVIDTFATGNTNRLSALILLIFHFK